MRNVLVVAVLVIGCWSEMSPAGGPGSAGAGGGSAGAPAAGTGGGTGSGQGSGGSAGTGAAGGGGGAGTGPGSGGAAGAGQGGTGGAGQGSGGVAGAGPGGAGPAPTADGGAADRAGAVAVNPFVYVGSAGASAIQIFQLDLQTGALMPRGSAPSGPSPNYLAFHPTANFLYALNEVAAGRVVAFSVNPTTGALTTLNSASSGGGGPAHISVHRSGRWLLAANYQSGHAAALPIRADGQLGPPVQPELAGAAAHMIVDDGVSGRFVFVPSKGANRLLQYRFDDTTGRLEPNDPAFLAQGGAPRHMVFHRSGRWAFLLTEAGRSVISYRYDSATGLLGGATPLQVPGMNARADGAHISIHPTRDILYASIRFDDRIAIFDIDADGRVQNPRFVSAQIARPWDFAIDPSGRYFLVANNDNATVKVFRIDETTGGLTPVGNGASVSPGPRFVGIFVPRL